MSIPAQLRIAIVGGGPVGMAAACFLHDGKHHVSLIEQAPSLRATGAGLLLQPSGLAVLDRLGLASGLIRQGGLVTAVDGRDPEGKPVLDLDYLRLHPLAFGLGIQRSHLFTALAAAVSARGIQVTTGKNVIDAPLDAAGRWIAVESGERAGPFDLVIDASGWQSALRKSTADIHHLSTYPYGALWALLPDNRRTPPAPILAQRYRGGRQMIGLLPVGKNEAGQPMLAFFYSVRHDALAALKQAGFAAFRQSVADLWPDAADVIAPLNSFDDLIMSVYGDCVLNRWHGERMLYLGDAAHAMSPQLGQGVNLGLQDALTIATLLAMPGALPERLSAYSQARRSQLIFYQKVSRWMTPVFQGEFDRMMPLRDAVLPIICRLPWVGQQMAATLAGVKTGWLGWELPPGDVLAKLRAAAP